MHGPDGEALALLGLAARAGAVVFGTVRVRDASREGRVRYAIVAGDASANSRGRVLPALERRGVPVTAAFDRERLGAAIGRAPVSAVGVTDRRFAQRLVEVLGAGDAAPPRAPFDGRVKQ